MDDLPAADRAKVVWHRCPTCHKPFQAVVTMRFCSRECYDREPFRINGSLYQRGVNRGPLP
jgi:hypothetical protein